MRIRCKNCYRVLNENEEYCTSCGEHSVEMEEYMKFGKKEMSESGKFRLALILFGFIAFIGTGALSIALAAVEGDTTNRLMYDLNSHLITSIGLLVALLIAFRKQLKGIFFKGNRFQILGAFGIGLILITIACLLSLLTSFTKVLPTHITDYMSSANRTFESFGSASILRIIIMVVCVAICEEYIYRHRLIDFFDDVTMLSDFWIITLSSLISTFLSFLWTMSLDVFLMSFLINIVGSAIYIYTNRSLGVNIILRITLSLSILLINFLI